MQMKGMFTMSSKRRQRRLACEGKVKHKTKMAANIACIRTMIKNSRTKLHGGTLRVYFCSSCSHWHNGHVPDRKVVLCKRDF